MATRIKPLYRTTTKSLAAEKDGRMLAARLLRYMGRLNAGGYPRVRDSQKALLSAIYKFESLTASEQQRFASVINEYVASAMQGCFLDSDAFIREPAKALEGHSIRLSNQCLAERRQAQAAGVNHGR